MSDIIFWVNDALGASLLVALFASVVWGVFSVLLSPCHLGTIPLVVGMVGATTRAGGRRNGAVLSFSFAGGMLLAIAVLGAIAATAGHALQGLGAVTNYVIAGIFLIAGLNLTGILPLPLPSLTIKPGNRKGVVAAFVIGFVFGVGLSPCTFAFLAPIIGLTFGTATSDPLRAAVLVLTFGVGHCAVIGLAGSSTELVQRYLDWNEGSRAVGLLKVICGVLVLVAAAVLVYTA